MARETRHQKKTKTLKKSPNQPNEPTAKQCGLSFWPPSDKVRISDEWYKWLVAYPWKVWPKNATIMLLGMTNAQYNQIRDALWHEDEISDLNVGQVTKDTTGRKIIGDITKRNDGPVDVYAESKHLFAEERTTEEFRPHCWKKLIGHENENARKRLARALVKDKSDEEWCGLSDDETSQSTKKKSPDIDSDVGPPPTRIKMSTIESQPSRKQQTKQAITNIKHIPHLSRKQRARSVPLHVTRRPDKVYRYHEHERAATNYLEWLDHQDWSSIHATRDNVVVSSRKRETVTPTFGCDIAEFYSRQEQDTLPDSEIQCRSKDFLNWVKARRSPKDLDRSEGIAKEEKAQQRK
ncbi:hypothetical protein MMC25_008050 [Agyrium rufum]|nr:hypothetical protein [Agyrium rufum]